MADKKISALTAASTPLGGTEVLPIVQSGSTVKVSVNNLTAGKSVSMKDFTANSGAANQECRLQYSDNTGGRTVILRMSSSSLAPFDGYGAYIKATQGGGVDVHSLAFGTTIGTPSDKLTVRYDGLVTVETDNLKIGTAGKGIDFSANGGDVLSQYDEGTWTPVATGIIVNSGTPVWSGTYTRIGRTVVLQWALSGGANINTTLSSYLSIPFTALGNSWGTYGNVATNTHIGGIVTYGALLYFGTVAAGISSASGTITIQI
jgi:hypothetical protein